MDNQHRKIVGYRELTEVEIDLMNRIKQASRNMLDLVNEVDTYIDNQYRNLNASVRNSETDAQFVRINIAEPFKWQQIAKTDLQKGAMALVRAVAQPTDC